MILPMGAPAAVAVIRGTEGNPGLRGTAQFYPQEGGTWVWVRVHGLPRDGFFALHIHEGGTCAGKDFSGTMGHWNPTGKHHPDHLGDLPPLLSWKGQARFGVWAGKVPVGQIIGRTLVIHSGTDDFRTQPSGDAGVKIACGEILAADRRT